MKRKQQLGEFWVCVIFFACVCGRVRYDNCVSRFLLFLADFTIFRGLLKINLVLGIKVLVSTEYLKTFYILYSEW
jgi:hypothetical protein